MGHCVHRFWLLSRSLKPLSDEVSLLWFLLLVTIFFVLFDLTTSALLSKVSSTLAEYARVSASPKGASSLIADTGEEGQEATTSLQECVASSIV